MESVYLALGSNLGAREEHLRSALRGLAKHAINTVCCAPVYSTEPREILDQPWFLNTVLEANTVLDPCQLLQACLQIEEENQRRRDTSKGPRTLDIDIIFYGKEIIQTPGLTIPHPGFSGRRFVLVPLAEIAPGLEDPRSGKTIRQLLAECPDSSTVTLVSDVLASFRPFPTAPR